MRKRGLHISTEVERAKPSPCSIHVDEIQSVWTRRNFMHTAWTRMRCSGPPKWTRRESKEANKFAFCLTASDDAQLSTTLKGNRTSVGQALKGSGLQATRSADRALSHRRTKGGKAGCRTARASPAGRASARAAMAAGARIFSRVFRPPAPSSDRRAGSRVAFHLA